MGGREPKMTLPTGTPPASEPPQSLRGFTLIELVVVMALMVTILGLSAPSLSRSLKARGVKQEAARLLATAEYAREEAISQGTPMEFWINSQTGQFGAQPKSGYQGIASRQKELSLPSKVRCALANQGPAQNGKVVAMAFDPDGTPEAPSVASITLTDQQEESASLVLTQDGWGFEIAK